MSKQGSQVASRTEQPSRGPVDWARHYAGLREAGEHPLLTAREARDLVDDLGTQLYWAQDAHAFVGEMCAIVERKQKVPEGAGTVSTADVREWLKGPRCIRVMAVDASMVPEARPQDDEELITQALRWQVMAAMARSGRSQSSVARELHVSVKHLNRMVTGRAKLTLWWASRILRVCGMRLVVVDR